MELGKYINCKNKKKISVQGFANKSTFAIEILKYLELKAALLGIHVFVYDFLAFQCLCLSYLYENVFVL